MKLLIRRLGSRLIDSDDWVPSVAEPKNMNSGLSRVMFSLQQRGAIQMALILFKKSSSKKLSRSPTEDIWTWRSRKGYPPSPSDSEISLIKLTGEALSSLYLIGELNDEDLISDLEYDTIEQMDELVSSMIQDFLKRNLVCSIPIIPSESLAALIAAAGDADLRGWEAGPTVRLWCELNLPEELLLPTFTRWSFKPKEYSVRQLARDFTMKFFFNFAGKIVLNSDSETHKFSDWISKCSHLEDALLRLQGGACEK